MLLCSPSIPRFGREGLRPQHELCYPEPDRKERSEVVTLSRGIIPMSFPEGEVFTLGTRAKKPERKYTCHPGLSLSPQQSHPLQGGHAGSWVREVSESAMPGTQSEKCHCSSFWTGRTQPSTCTHVHIHYPGTSPSISRQKDPLGLSTHYKGAPHCLGPQCLCPKQRSAGYPLCTYGGVSGLRSHTAQKEKR